MEVKVLRPGDVAHGIFAWLIGDKVSVSALKGCEPLTPLDLAAVIADEQLSDPEVHGIWCYVRLISFILEIDAKKVKSLMSALHVPRDFDARCDTLLRLDVTDVSSIIEKPERVITDAINAIVIDWASEQPNQPQKLPGLSVVLFEHPMDRLFLKALRAIPFVPDLMGRVVDVFARMEETRLMASALEVTDYSLPRLNSLYRETAEVLGFKEIPPLYIEPGGINAYTTGSENVYVVLSSGAATLLSKNELRYVLGHELGHVMAGHVRYYSLARALAGMGQSAAATIPVLGDIGNLAISTTLMPALTAWARRSELTADRAGALACQDKESILRAMVKLMGFPAAFYGHIDGRALLLQAQRYGDRLQESLFDRLSELNQVFGQEHPRMVTRSIELSTWIGDGSLDEILHLDQHGREAMAKAVQADSISHGLMTTTNAMLCDWASREFTISRRQCGPVIRRMVREQEPPTDTPLESILHIEMNIIKNDGVVKYKVFVLINRDGVPVRVGVDIPWPSEWEYAPDEVRDEMIQHNRDKIARVLYSVPKRA